MKKILLIILTFSIVLSGCSASLSDYQKLNKDISKFTEAEVLEFSIEDTCRDCVTGYFTYITYDITNDIIYFEHAGYERIYIVGDDYYSYQSEGDVLSKLNEEEKIIINDRYERELTSLLIVQELIGEEQTKLQSAQNYFQVIADADFDELTQKTGWRKYTIGENTVNTRSGLLVNSMRIEIGDEHLTLPSNIL